MCIRDSREITQLRREVWRGECSVTQDPSNPNMISVRTNIPVDVGGWEVREIGIFDEENRLIVFASAPGWRKLAIINGTSNPMELNILITVTDASAIELNISSDEMCIRDSSHHLSGTCFPKPGTGDSRALSGTLQEPSTNYGHQF